MAATDTKRFEKLIIQQGKEIKKLSQRINVLESKASIPPQETYEEETPEPVTKVKNTDKENPTSLFKIFGIVGIIMIVLGVVYFYKYAVDNGWIGITGRIALGVIASLVIIGIGLFMYKKEYYNFSQIIVSCGLGILYFTVFATYHFEAYRQALGMNLILNTLLLLVIMAGGMFLGIRMDRKSVVYWSLGLGFLAAFLSGIDGNTLHILIYVLIIDLIVLAIAKSKSWYMGIPAQVLTYVAFIIWFYQGVYDPKSILGQTNMPMLMTFVFLGAYYLIFTILSFVQASDFKEGECTALSVINTLCLAGFGLGIINEYAPEANGVYLIIAAAVTLFVGYLSRKQDFENIFDLYFLGTCILVAITIPVQFDKTIVTVLWVLMSMGLAYSGLKMGHKRLFYVGYIGFVIPFLRVFLFDLWFLRNIVERWLAVGSCLVGLIVMQVWIAKKFSFSKAKNDIFYNIYSVIGMILSIFWVAREVYDLNLSWEGRNVLLTISWALLAIAFITYGVIMRRKIFNWSGVILFGIVVAKVLLIDLSGMQNILRVLVLIIVGALSLIGSFVFVKNREKIKEYM